MAAVPPRGLVEQDGGCGRTARFGPVDVGNVCNAVTDINLAQRFGSGKDERSSSWSVTLWPP
jgi:hypothetical protein